MTDFFRKKCDAFLIAPLALAVTGVLYWAGESFTAQVQIMPQRQRNIQGKLQKSPAR